MCISERSCRGGGRRNLLWWWLATRAEAAKLTGRASIAGDPVAQAQGLFKVPLRSFQDVEVQRPNEHFRSHHISSASEFSIWPELSVKSWKAGLHHLGGQALPFINQRLGFIWTDAGAVSLSDKGCCGGSEEARTVFDCSGSHASKSMNLGRWPKHDESTVSKAATQRIGQLASRASGQVFQLIASFEI